MQNKRTRFGRYEDLISRYHPEEVIGSSRQAVIPGMIHAHHHVGLTPFQLGSLDMPLETWIIARRALQEIDPYLDTLWCAIQMAESGITTVQHNHMAARLPPELGLYEGARPREWTKQRLRRDSKNHSRVN